jgi:HD-like signal output (HDOD) protein
MLNSNLNKTTIDSILRKTSTVYSLPLIYDRLNEAINHPRSSLTDIGRVISKDQGLATRLLKMANSPVLGYHAKIDSITRALTLIGTQQVRDLALAIAVMGSFKGISAELISMQHFWRHSIACGILSRNIAIYRREVNPESFFLAGMLHDLGLLVMCVAVPEIVNEVLLTRQKDQELCYKVEQRLLGFDHAAVGMELLNKWGIPANISEPIAFHHNPSAAFKYAAGAAVIHLADIMCHSMEISLASSWLVPALNDRAWKSLDLPLSQLEVLIRQSEAQIEETCEVLGESN